MSEFKYVPVDPTDEMMTAAAQMGYTGHVYLRVYKAMIAAAPAHPSPAESDKESPRNGPSDYEIAEAIEALKWNGVSIGHKAILQSAVFALKSRSKKDS